MKSIRFLLWTCLCFSTQLDAQTDREIACIKNVIYYMDSMIDHRFYYENIPDFNLDTYKENPDTLFVLLDSDTYEEYKLKGSAIFLRDSLLRQKEVARYKARSNYQNGIYVLSPISKYDINVLNEPFKHKSDVIKNTYDSVGYYFNLDELKPIELSFEKFAQFDDLTILKHTETHINTYKYAIKAFYYFSSVLTNRKDNRLLMHCRHHYCIDGSRSGTGGSFWALFDGSTSNCTLVDILGLSEE